MSEESDQEDLKLQRTKPELRSNRLYSQSQTRTPTFLFLLDTYIPSVLLWCGVQNVGMSSLITHLSTS